VPEMYTFLKLLAHAKKVASPKGVSKSVDIKIGLVSEVESLRCSQTELEWCTNSSLEILVSTPFLITTSAVASG
jgi:hypothetical protein